jgi:hypothetical protein
VFNEAVRHNTDWSRRIGSKVMVDKFVYHYVPSQGEDVSSACPEDKQNVTTFIKRERNKPIVTAVPNIRSRFCFDFTGKNLMRTRELSCHCDNCLARDWDKCEYKRVTGEWVKTRLEYETGGGTLSAAKNLRSRKAKLSFARTAAATHTKRGEVIALESANDPDFGFWLAEVINPATMHYGKAEIVTHRDHGDVHKKYLGNYIKVRIIERCPPDSKTLFTAFAKEIPWEVDAEGVIARNVKLRTLKDNQERPRTRSTTSNSSQQGVAGGKDCAFKLPDEELKRCTACAEEKMDPNGGEQFKNPVLPDTAPKKKRPKPAARKGKGPKKRKGR